VSDGKGGNEGQSYRGPITASVRERNYKKDQVVEIIQNNILVGSGKVYSWDFSVNELVLYDIIGKFEKTSEVIGIGYENCRKFINNGIDSIEIIPIDPSVGDTKNNLFKPSSANYYSKNIAKIELLSYNNLPIQNLLLEQESDSSYHVKNIVFNGNDTVNITENKNIFQFSTDTDDNVSDLNLTASTVLSNELTTTTTNLFTITVDDANNFPVFDGILYIDGQLINYRSRSSNQFFGCIATHSKLYAANTEIWNYGRYLININRKWNSNTTYKKDSIVYYEDNLYICVNTIQGTTSNIPPTHVVGVKSDGTIRWKYHGKSNIKYVLKVYINNSKSFVYGRILSSTESPNILNSGALHSPGIFKFKKESSNLYSSKLLNYFRVNDSYSLDSTGGFQGVHSLYRHEDAYYVSSSGIPLYYDQSASLQYSNQKHLKRFKISNGLIDYPIKANITNQTSSEKSIGLTIDGIQIQSYKGREVTLNNSQYRYNLNYTLTTDLYGGYVHDIADDQYIDKNLNLQRSLGGNEYLQLKITSQFNDFYSIQNTSHGKIIGWSYDGHPIYSGKGYTTSLDKNSSLVNMTSSYRLKTSRSGGPSIVTYPLGTFIDDYEYVSGLGTLDEFNGRFCVTPEFPNGIYAYFAIFEFPYFIGPNYRSIPDKFNLSPVIRNDRIPSFFRRISRPNNVYYPKVNNDLGESILSNTISSGGVNSVIVEYSGNDYLSGDKVIFDNTGTSGSGAFAYVGEILGPELNYYEVVGNILSLYTKINHNLLPNDYIVLRTTPVEDIITKSLDSLSIIQSNVTITGKNLYRVNLLQDINYKLTTSKVGNFSLSYDINNDNKFYDENIIISNSPKYLQFNANTLPSTTYLHIDNNIYEIQIAKNPLFFKYTILQVTNNSFVIKTNIPESQVVELMQLYKLKPSSEVNIGNCIPYIKPSIEPPKIFFTHTSNSITAKGGIFSIELVNSGSGYKKLPKIISIDSQFGYGAIVQGDSTTIGSIKSLEYNSINKFIFSNYTIDYEIDLPISTKIIQNFYIDKIEIINRGLNYTKIPTILVNNQEIGKFEITVDSGQLTSIKVIDGLYNLKSEPIITVVGNGSNASVKAIIKRKNILKDSIVTKFGDTGIKGRVINFDSDTSILEILPISGKFNTNDIIVTNDNLQYGKIYSANYPQSISKSSSNSKLRPKFLNNVGFISSNTQKIPDSNYYQNYSYNISYVKNVSSWKSNVIDNTHVSGFKLFGKNLIENSEKFFDSTNKIFKNSVIFDINLNTLVKLKLNRPECKKEQLYFERSNQFPVYTIVYGINSQTYGLVVDKNNNSTTSLLDDYIIAEVIAGPGFELGEIILSVPVGISLENSTTTSNSLLFFNGILQSKDFYSIVENSLNLTFSISSADEILVYNFPDEIKTLKFNKLSDNTLKLINDTSIQNQYNLIISYSGVVQNPGSYTLDNNILELSEPINKNDVFIYYNENLSDITISGDSIATTFTLSRQVNNSSKLLVFYSGIGQSYLITNYTVNNTTIVFSETVELSNIFAFYIDDASNEIVDLTDLYENIIKTKFELCSVNSVRTRLESSSVKNKNSFYEIQKDSLEGTFYADSTSVYGVNSKFIYTNPEYSSSYIEILDDISSNFNGTSKNFNITYSGGFTYVPNYRTSTNDSIIVSINGTVLNKSEYTLTSTQIRFNLAYSSGTKCTIWGLNSTYTLNIADKPAIVKSSAFLDTITDQFDGINNTFPLSLDGVPQYIYDIENIFCIRNGVLQKPVLDNYSVNNNKITFVDTPTASETFKSPILIRFGIITPTQKNILLDTITIVQNQSTYNLRKTAITYTRITNIEDILISVNGVVKQPGVDFTVNIVNSTVTFLRDLPIPGDEIFIIGMYSNETIQLTPLVGQQYTYTLNKSLSTYERKSLLVSYNGVLQSINSGFKFLNSTTIIFDDNLDVEPESNLFALLLENAFVLDEIYTPFDSDRTKYNLYFDKENFEPEGSYDNDSIPDSSSILVIKNGNILNPGTVLSNSTTDYILTGSIKTIIEFKTAPINGDTISIRAVGCRRRINSISSNFGQFVYNLTIENSTPYYHDSVISRPREPENQFLIIRNGKLLSPIYDYYILFDKIIFTQILTGNSPVYIFEYVGKLSDVKVNSFYNNIKIDDQIKLRSENSSRIVTEILSPTALKTTPYVGLQSTGFSGTSSISNGKLTNITITNAGRRYSNPTVIVGVGCGVTPKIIVGANKQLGGTLDSNTIDINYFGNNIYVNPTLVPTSYAYVLRNTQLSTSNIQKVTTLTANVTESQNFIPVKNANFLDSNPPVVTVSTSSGNPVSGSGASFRAYVTNNKIVKIDVLQTGSGYDINDTQLEVTLGGGFGAVLEPVMDSLGRITSVKVRNGGTGYDTFETYIISVQNRADVGPDILSRDDGLFSPDDYPFIVDLRDTDTVTTSTVSIILREEVETSLEILNYTYVDTNTNVLYGCTRSINGVVSPHEQNSKIFSNIL
jgi:hypothetical protein